MLFEGLHRADLRREHPAASPAASGVAFILLCPFCGTGLDLCPTAYRAVPTRRVQIVLQLIL